MHNTLFYLPSSDNNVDNSITRTLLWTYIPTRIRLITITFKLHFEALTLIPRIKAYRKNALQNYIFTCLQQTELSFHHNFITFSLTFGFCKTQTYITYTDACYWPITMWMFGFRNSQFHWVWTIIITLYICKL